MKQNKTVYRTPAMKVTRLPDADVITTSASSSSDKVVNPVAPDWFD